MHYKLSREERETQFLTNEASDSWDFWTSSERWARKVERLGYPVKPDHQSGWSCSIPKDRLRILRPEKRKLTAAQLAALSNGRFSSKSARRDEAISDQHPPARLSKGVNESDPKTSAAEPS